MNKELWGGIFIICLLGCLGFFLPFKQNYSLPTTLAEKMGRQIWQNESAGKIEGLTAWNQGEDFASLGIGHFIWYPEGREQRFKQTFPELLIFLKSKGVQLPTWLDQAKGLPWQTREEFQSAQNDPHLQELRGLLAEHVDLQILFMVNRLDRALPALLKDVSAKERHHITYQFYRLTQTPGGVFVLLDYLNFKGEGTGKHESYQGYGWGLRQVLQGMNGSKPGVPAVDEFIESAKKLLTFRVENSPKERGEERWLKGWHNRLENYRSFSRNLERHVN
jgi:hypothetical protein